MVLNFNACNTFLLAFSGLSIFPPSKSQRECNADSGSMAKNRLRKMLMDQCLCTVARSLMYF